MSKQYCVIMAGGVGSRFWPASTAEKPKQFLDILGTGRTLLQQTFDRFKPLVPAENILILTNEAYKSLVQKQLPELNENQIICEPARRNTAPCILYSALKIWKKDPNACFVVTPADHIVTNSETFNNLISSGLKIVRDNPENSITLGIHPSYAATGFGYIKAGNEIQKGVFKVEQFTEKPNLSSAKDMVDSGNYFWNSGLFIWNSNTLVEKYKNTQPAMYQLFAEGLDSLNTPSEREVINDLYPNAEDISVDYAILEQDKNVLVLPGDFGWSDLGSWSSLTDHIKQDTSNNYIIKSGANAIEDSTGNIIYTESGKKIMISGLKNFIVVDTKEGLLICPIEKEQEIKQYLSTLK